MIQKKAIRMAVCLLAALPSVAAGAKTREWSLRKHLAVAGQGEIEKIAKKPGEHYRFILHDPGFTESTLVLISKERATIRLQACHISLHDYYASRGRSGVERKERLASIEEWEEIIGGLSRIDFWHYRAEPRYGSDGSYWILEGAKGGRSSRIEEWCPDPGEFRKICLLLWRLSGLFMGNYRDIAR